MFNLRKLFTPKLAREAFEAYFYRLPNNVRVSWFRDGKFIVGKVVAGEREFMTQGKNVDDFIEMVNDAVYAVENIPKNYIYTLRKIKTYEPSPAEEAKLRNLDVKKSELNFNKQKKVLEVA